MGNKNFEIIESLRDSILWNGDCLELMKNIPDNSVDLIVTDPPYLIKYKTNYRKNKSHKFCNEIQNDSNYKFISLYIQECYRILKDDTAMYMFCNCDHVDFFKQELEKCGKPTPKYLLECNECKEKRIYDNATKMTYEEYIKKYPGYPIVDTVNGKFYWELEDYLDFIYNETEPPYPTYCFGAYKERLELDIENHIADINTEANTEDGCGLEPTKGLIDFINNWNKKNGQNLYYCDQRIVILINKEDYQK